MELLTGHPLESSVNARYALLTMSRIRKLEEAVEDLFGRGMMHGTMHLSIGQEASPTGVCMALDITDQITSTHRGHGHCVAKGADLMRMVAELLGKENGYCGGRGGSMHIADVETGNLGANGIVGGGIPIAIGAALASKMMKKGTIAVSFFGDGAMNEGAFHEAANLAAIWKLPVILVCENNKYGMSSSTELAFAIDHLSERGLGYGIPGYTVDGNDVPAIAQAAKKAIDKARAGQGPTLIECKTYRFMGHWTGDPQPYRTREEIEEWKKKCPIKRLRKHLVDEWGFTEQTVSAVEAVTADMIEKAAEFALNSPQPDPTHVLDDVFFEGEGALL